MKTLYLLLAVILVACGDSPVSPTNPPPVQGGDSLLYEKDSLVLYCLAGDSTPKILQGILPEGYPLDSTIDKIKIMFNAETNFDSSQFFKPALSIDIDFYNYGIETVFQGLDSISINGNHSLIAQNQYNKYFKTNWVLSLFVVKPTLFDRFIKVKNIKIHKTP